MISFPPVAALEQTFPRPRLGSVERFIEDSFRSGIVSPAMFKGKRIALTAGSRGISNMGTILQSVIGSIREMGGDPFILPAMGSHGGGTPEGQLHILADYGITPEKMGVPIDASLETVCIGKTGDGIPVYVARSAYQADGIIVLNRIKPHTDFTGEIESGLMKIITVGLGKVDGARIFHSRTSDFEYDYLVKTIARQIIATGKILLGIAILENAYHETAAMELISPDRIEIRERELLQQAKQWMPSLPVDQADVLILDRIGKDISGVGMDPNITGRRYRINRHWPEKPDITRIVVMDLSEKSMGNAAGIGLADFCSRKVVEKIDKRITYLNAVTSRNTVCSNIPLHFDTDRETLEQTFLSLGEIPPDRVRLLHIRDTMSLTRIEASEALLPELQAHPHVSTISALHPFQFNEFGNWLPFPES